MIEVIRKYLKDSESVLADVVAESERQCGLMKKDSALDVGTQYYRGQLDKVRDILFALCEVERGKN